MSPPDTNGDIGRTHYVQTVNLAVQVFNINGTPLTAPFKMSSLFAALGACNICATDDDGDPIVLYDHLADRWMISQFALTAPFHQCIAVSQTGDPTGAYYVYDFVMPNNYANDYPHFGVWPDAYYMTDNQFNASLTAFAGAGVFAFDRAKMLVGDPTATLHLLRPAGGAGHRRPVAVRPRRPAAAGRRRQHLRDVHRQRVRRPGWRRHAPVGVQAELRHAGGTRPITEITTEAAPIPVAAFDPMLAHRPRRRRRSPARTARLDTISDRLMYRLQYRNFGTHESLVVNHTVNVGPAPPPRPIRAGVRYYELRRTGGVGQPLDHPRAGHARAGRHRAIAGWVRAALDRAGNLAVGFSASDGTAVFPGIRHRRPPGRRSAGRAGAGRGHDHRRQPRRRPAPAAAGATTA